MPLACLLIFAKPSASKLFYAHNLSAVSPQRIESAGSSSISRAANAIKLRAGESATELICCYFVTEFSSDHITTYKKRPIYWLFTSGKNGAIGALVYLHRYSKDTVGHIRTDYVLKLDGKLDKEIERVEADIDNASTATARKAATKRLKTLKD